MKLRVLFYTFFILLFLILQTTLLKYAAVCGVTPNLIIVFVIITSLLRGTVQGGAAGFFSGLALDLLFGRVIGFYALLGFCLGITAGNFNKRLFRENLLVVVLLTFAYSVAYETLVYIFSTIMRGNIELLYPLTRVVIPEAIYNCVIAVLIYILFIKADRWFNSKEKLSRQF